MFYRLRFLSFVKLCLSGLILILIAGCGAQSFWGADFNKNDQRSKQDNSELPPTNIGFKLDSNDLVLWKQAQKLITQERYAQAIAKLDKLFKSIENENNVHYEAKIIFWKAYCNEKLGNVVKAIEQYENIIENYFDQKTAEEAARRLKNLR